MNREDLSDHLVHLTKGDTLAQAEGTFRKIIGERRLIGGTGDVRGGFRVVCFSEAPIDVLSRIFANPKAHGFRYRPFGIMVNKLWLYEHGGRPVIYQSESEYAFLHEPIQYLHVRYEPSRGIDFTWEREWRIRIDELPIDPNNCTLIVPRRDWEKKLRDEHDERDFQKALMLQWPGKISNFPWHFLALEDLGVKVL